MPAHRTPQGTVFVQPGDLLLGSGGEQFSGYAGQDAVVSYGVVAEGLHQLRGHQVGVTGAGQEMLKARQQLLSIGILHGQAGAQPTAQGSNSSRRNLALRRTSPARTTVRRIWESNWVLLSRRSSLRTAGCISCASSINSTGRNKVPSRWASQRSRRALKPPQRLCGLSSTPNRSPFRDRSRPDYCWDG